jgi:prepilin-type N-terminal cleavage/methylation domain-containing protein
MRGRHAHSGYSLLELLIALSILAIGLIGSMKLFTQSLENIQVANERTTVAEIARSTMARTRSAGAKDLLVYRPRNVTVDAEKDNSDDQAYYNKWNLHVGQAGGGGEVFLQRMTLSFEFPDGRTQSYVTYVARQ